MAKRTQHIQVEVIRGVEGFALYVANTRVAGPKPWGGGRSVASWTVDAGAFIKLLRSSRGDAGGKEGSK